MKLAHLIRITLGTLDHAVDLLNRSYYLFWPQ